MTARARRVTTALLVVYLAGVARMTLVPDIGLDPAFDAVRRIAGGLQEHGIPVTFELVEAAANVVMFVPFGVLVGLLVRRAWLVVVLGCALSAAIEASQALFLPTRAATVQDVVMNTLGAALGLAALLTVRRTMGRGAGQDSGNTCELGGDQSTTGVHDPKNTCEQTIAWPSAAQATPTSVS